MALSLNPNYPIMGLGLANHWDAPLSIPQGVTLDLDSIAAMYYNPVFDIQDPGLDSGFLEIGELGRDATSGVVFREDWQQIVRNVIARSFRDQPRVIRQLAALGGNTLQSSLDGSKLMRIGKLNDIDRPGYGMVPRETHTALSLGEITQKMPQIFQTATMTVDDWKQTAAGMDRWALLNGEIVRKIQNEEDYVGFQGSTKENTSGLIGAAAEASDLGDPTGAWGVDSGSNGHLTNFQIDMKAAIDEFVANGLGDKKIDVVMTSYIYTLIRNKIFFNRSGDNLTWFQNLINGGEIFVTNNLQAPKTAVSSTANSILMIAREPGTMQNWCIISSEMDQQMVDNHPLWNITYGLREKFVIKVLNADYVRWMDGISNATS